MLEILSSGGRILALYGALMLIFGIFFLPDSWDKVLQNMTARYGLAVAGVAAIIIGCFLSALGG